MVHRPIPRTGESLPVVGLGTWQTFDVGTSAAERAPLAQVIHDFLRGGGRVVDSSPMYGHAEAVAGDLLAADRATGTPFIATKVWTTGRAAGEAQMRESARRLHADPVDLMQVHNLLDWETHLPVLRAWKEQGRIRHVGITHYAPSAFPLLERLVRTEKVDFVQLPYSIASREAEKRLLPAAADTGTAVLVMRPFEAGSLVHGTRGRAVPDFARELGVTTWPQLFLKWILSHPAVTAAIPATANPQHMADNVAAGCGALPDEALRRKIVAALEA